MAFHVTDALLRAYATSDRMNAFLIQNVPDDGWSAKPAGGKGRNIASIAAHIHNVRLMWLKSAGKTAVIPDKLDGATKEQTIQALAKSFVAIQDLLRDSLNGDGRVKGFKPDAGSFLAYMLAHDAHHRGQISMLARQLGHPISQSAMYGLWEWGTR